MYVRAYGVRFCIRCVIKGGFELGKWLIDG